MKAIVNTGPNRLELQDLPLPDPGPGQVRIRTVACGICATDLEMIAGWKRTGFPAVPGHEWAGVVEASGPGGDTSLIGRLCVAENVLSDGGEVGFEHPGGYAEYFLTEARNVHYLPLGFPAASAALVEPLAVCIRGLQRVRWNDQDRVVIFGDGPIGLLILMLFKAGGIRQVVLAGGRSERLQLARELGADTAVNYHDAGDLTRVLGQLTHDPYTLAAEASGSGSAVQAAMRLVGVGGKILVIGDYGSSRADFGWNEILHRELELIGSNASAGAWPEAVRRAASRTLPLERLITRRFPATQFAEAMALVRDRSKSVVKVILEWGA